MHTVVVSFADYIDVVSSHQERADQLATEEEQSTPTAGEHPLPPQQGRRNYAGTRQHKTHAIVSAGQVKGEAEPSEERSNTTSPD